MIFCIDAYRTWIEVADDNLYKEHVIPRNNRTDFLVSRTLVLRACKPHGTYDRGMTWTIPEHDLDAALATYRKQNGIFKSRMKKGASSLTAEDTENIIRLATHGIVRLELVVRPVHIPSKPYYLLLLGLYYSLCFLQCLSSFRHCCTGADVTSWQNSTIK